MVKNILFVGSEIVSRRWVFCTDLRTDSDFCFIHH